MVPNLGKYTEIKNKVKTRQFIWFISIHASHQNTVIQLKLHIWVQLIFFLNKTYKDAYLKHLFPALHFAVIEVFHWKAEKGSIKDCAVLWWGEGCWTPTHVWVRFFFNGQGWGYCCYHHMEQMSFSSVDKQTNVLEIKDKESSSGDYIGDCIWVWALSQLYISSKRNTTITISSIPNKLEG